MPYTTGRLIHDADAHVMETAAWVIGYADPAVREQLKPLTLTAVDGCLLYTSPSPRDS